MSEENTTQETTTQEEVESTEGANQTTEEMVPKSELQKVLGDMHKYKKTAKELEATIKEQEMSKLKDQQEWEKIAKIKEEEANKAIEESTKLKESFLNNQKYSAIKAAALANGIRKEALNDLELINFDDDVAIETTNTGKVKVLGAESAIKKLRADRPFWFGKSMGSVNTDSSEVVSGGQITMDKVMEAQKKANKSGEYGEYAKILKAYQAQQGA